jgi:preprotein translocase subunit SecG
MKIVAVLFFFCAVALILIILVQKGRGGGLSAAFAGGVASGLLGSKTGDFLTWVTIVLVSIFLVFAVVMAKYYKPSLGAGGEGTPPRAVSPVEPPQGSELPSPIDETGNEGFDINLPGTQ